MPNGVMAHFVARQVAAVTTRPQLTQGQGVDQMVGVAQQKLNVLAVAAKPLVIDADY